ncbi:hypothetical protein Thein_1122 [Thermodesulfatator indicus DSM 15286]|uniref:Fibronectin type-III domain-containing protein n=1 Tax=Thermodesulfatator indicus (strain DSM 15286 / JCM 11887 / CIR29812) TaxID=667014 RepID=F8AE22_THEID|nr:hypothetical protein [Thermodesulfatator indicus]AEH44993.1 hypothetical protein Thein_1122 [Thermodesulfatator indicus DSM 15286]
MKKLVIILFLSLFLGACGKKTPPQPPHAVRPEPPRNISVTLHFWGAELAFDVPRHKVDGDPLNGLKGLKIVRYEENIFPPYHSYQKEFWIPFTRKMFREIRRYHFRDSQLKEGYRYVYLVYAVKGWHSVSDPGESPSFAWHIPPAQVKSLKAIPGDATVTLSWTPVKKFMDNRPAKGVSFFYRIYRRPNQKSPSRALPVLLKETSFKDIAVVNGKSYGYQVAAVFKYFGSLIEGPKSEEVWVTPVDTTPPPSPEGLVAVPHKGGVLLRWRRSGAVDLLGYKVYRQRKRENPVLLTPKPISEPKFFDRPPAPGVYTYWVTAVDSSPRHKESRPSNKDTVKYEKEVN